MSASPQRPTSPGQPADAKPAPSSQANDDRLAELLESLTAELRAGRMPDLQAVCRAEPELATELMRL